MLADVSRVNDAHDLLKQALAAEGGNLNLRAFYIHFLVEANLARHIKEFVFATLKEHERHDIYSLCAAGWIHYHQARESRDSSPKGVQDRRDGFRRSAEFYERALHHDPMCAVAAQGLAIVIAEDAIGTLGGSLGPIAPDENAKRVKNARDALDVFAKVRESLDDGSVYANMGHCYYACDEYDRAIESVSFFFFLVVMIRRGDSPETFSTRPRLVNSIATTTSLFFCVSAARGMRRLSRTSRSSP